MVVMVAESSGVTSTRQTGMIGEEIACKFLLSKGFKIIERNHRKPWGEIDIIAEKGSIVRFVEVKAVSRENIPDISREMSSYRPEEQVHPAKLRKIARTAEIYMGNYPDKEFQIDVVGVFLDTKRRRARCRLFEQVL
jgi:putative endonuclease